MINVNESLYHILNNLGFNGDIVNQETVNFKTDELLDELDMIEISCEIESRLNILLDDSFNNPDITVKKYVTKLSEVLAR